MANDKHVWVAFKYERLPVVCSYCGVLRHEGECSRKDGKKNYGRWIRAEVEEVWEPDGTHEAQGTRERSSTSLEHPQEQARPDPDSLERAGINNKWAICTYDREAGKESMIRNEERSLVIVEGRGDVGREEHIRKQEEFSRIQEALRLMKGKGTWKEDEERNKMEVETEVVRRKSNPYNTVGDYWTTGPNKAGGLEITVSAPENIRDIGPFEPLRQKLLMTNPSGRLWGGPEEKEKSNLNSAKGIQPAKKEPNRGLGVRKRIGKDKLSKRKSLVKKDGDKGQSNTGTSTEGEGAHFEEATIGELLSAAIARRSRREQ